MLALLHPERHYQCPECGQRQVKRGPIPDGSVESVFHRCPKLAGVLAPIPQAGIRCTLQVVEREDYLHGDLPQTDGNGKVVMAVRTLRDDGEDCAVLAPTAVGRIG
jgi:hypothetical protein